MVNGNPPAHGVRSRSEDWLGVQLVCECGYRSPRTRFEQLARVSMREHLKRATWRTLERAAAERQRLV